MRNHTKLIQVAIILSITTVAGCDLKSDEKSYSYYVQHPAELEHDYHYCVDHPCKTMCHNIVKKYWRYKHSTGKVPSYINDEEYRGHSACDLDAESKHHVDIDKPL